jgi:hypothetical protein
MKGSLILIFIAIVVVLCVLVNSSDALDPKKTVGAWCLDDGKGNVAVDSSGNGRNGKIAGSPVWIAGKFGKALQVTSSDSVTIPDDDALEFGIKSFSVVTWFKFSNAQDWNRIVRGRNPGAWGGGNTGWELQTQGVSINWSLDDTAKNALQTTHAGVADGEWHHAAMIVNREKKTLLAYLDGENEQLLNIANIVSISSNTDPVIGGGLNGSIDDVAIFNGAITQDDVKAIMDKGLPEVLKGNASVSSLDKTASMWGMIKSLE